MTRPIDHVVLPCFDLAAAAARFQALGFHVGRRNRHPWGTENHVLQFPGAFVELIALAPDYRPVTRDDDAFPFAGFLAGQAGSASPSAMLVLRSDQAKADAAVFEHDGIGAGRTLDFSRDAAAPDGRLRTVAFSLGFAQARAMPRLGFFVCQQHHPENFWDPALQNHPNGVTALTGVVLVAERPPDHADFLERFAGRHAVPGASGTLELDTGGGLIEVLTPAGVLARYPEALTDWPAGSTPALVALRFEVDASFRSGCGGAPDIQVETAGPACPVALAFQSTAQSSP